MPDRVHFGNLYEVFNDPDMDIMVTDLFTMQTKTTLSASGNYQETALELGLVRVRMQGYRDGSYDETIEAINGTIKELYSEN